MALPELLHTATFRIAEKCHLPPNKPRKSGQDSNSEPFYNSIFANSALTRHGGTFVVPMFIPDGSAYLTRLLIGADIY